MKQIISSNRTFLMGLAMISIVIFHHGGAHWYINIPKITPFFAHYGYWGVDIFLFLSGFGCVYALHKYTNSIFLKKRVQRLLPTCILCGSLVYTLDSLFFHVEQDLSYSVIRLLSLNRWYIQAIMICYAICPLCYLVLKRYKVYGLFSLILICVLTELITPELGVFKLRWILGRIPVFLIGMYIALFDIKMTRM